MMRCTHVLMLAPSTGCALAANEMKGPGKPTGMHTSNDGGTPTVLPGGSITSNTDARAAVSAGSSFSTSNENIDDLGS